MHYSLNSLDLKLSSTFQVLTATYNLPCSMIVRTNDQHKMELCDLKKSSTKKVLKQHKKLRTTPAWQHLEYLSIFNGSL